jgi:hypothetical protein
LFFSSGLVCAGLHFLPIFGQIAHRYAHLAPQNTAAAVDSLDLAQHEVMKK